MGRKDFLSITFYKYVDIKNPESVRDSYRELMLEHDAKGKIILSREGINGAVSGKARDVTMFMENVKKMEGMHDLSFRVTRTEDYGFKRTLVKIRPEIVPLGVPGVTPSTSGGGIPLKPSELREWYERKEDFIVLDTRNDYEYEAGRFKDSVNPGIKRFRDFQNTTSLLEKYKDKKIVTFCTGGVRCEKASAFLKSKGFKEVYKLDGGIIDFLKEEGGSGYFEGDCFVFDTREKIGGEFCRID